MGKGLKISNGINAVLAVLPAGDPVGCPVCGLGTAGHYRQPSMQAADGHFAGLLERTRRRLLICKYISNMEAEKYGDKYLSLILKENIILSSCCN
ncbi:MAG: hypothetical protein Q4A62_01100 [Eikenella sp.]|nr:hypothetical protein [Eikenella sp.]